MYRPRHAVPVRARVLVTAGLLPALLVVAGAVLAAGPGVAPAAAPGVLSVRDECAQALGYPSRSAADVAWLEQCVSALTAPTVPPTPTPTPSPSPTPSPTPAPTTPAAGWPTDATTGIPPGTALTPWTGSCDLRTANQVIVGAVFNCPVNVWAAGVVIRNSVIRGGPYWGANTRPGGTATFDHVTVQPSSGCNLEAALTGANYTASAVKVLDWGEGFWVTGGGNVLVSDSYARLCAPAGSGAHSDGIQAYQASGASVFRHNHIDQRGANSCCVTSPLFWSSSPGTRLTFVDNLVRGGGYSLRIHDGSGHVVTGNVVDRVWLFGPVLVDCVRVATWSGNRVATVGADLALSNPAALACDGALS